MTVANGESVTITATASDGTGSGIASVMADVSMLDSTQTDVALMMGADGSYSVDVTISKENTHANGSKTITVTAMDAAGNSSPMVESNGYVGQHAVLHLNDTGGSDGAVPRAVG